MSSRRSPIVDKTTEERFNRLAGRWLMQTAFLSVPDGIVAQPAFQAIVSMGEAVIPLVLRELEKDTGYWELALLQIAKENPVKPGDAGKRKRIKRAWLRWGRKQGYVWSEPRVE